MRIIGGTWKGKALISPEGTDIRPTGDRTREALFNLLMHLDDNPLEDALVVDLCCGSGALGLEALSRGAAQCIFIDNAGASLKLAEQNANKLGAGKRAEFIQANASQLPTAKSPAALVMMDPPYRHEGLVGTAYASLIEKRWLAAGGMFAVEQFAKTPSPTLPGAKLIKDRRYGKSAIRIYQRLA